MISSSTVKFLKDLSKHNNKTWFDANKHKYLDAKQDFESFITSLIKKTSAFDEDIKPLEVKNCTFRINRDIRFSNNKTPYKINMGASLNKGGKKSIYAGYYFHLEPGGKSFAGGGIWMPMAPELKKIRQEIDYCYDELKTILAAKKFKSEYGSLQTTDDVRLTNLPRNYEKNNPAAEFLKFKSILALKPISDSDLLQPDLLNKTSKTFEALKPLIKFINRALTVDN